MCHPACFILDKTNACTGTHIPSNRHVYVQTYKRATPEPIPLGVPSCLFYIVHKQTQPSHNTCAQDCGRTAPEPVPLGVPSCLCYIVHKQIPPSHNTCAQDCGRTAPEPVPLGVPSCQRLERPCPPNRPADPDGQAICTGGLFKGGGRSHFATFKCIREKRSKSADPDSQAH